MTLYILETKKEHLDDLLTLWNDGEVMQYVGFPNGLGYTKAQMETWHDYMSQALNTKHYVIYEEDLGFLGESYYHVLKGLDLASLDIKLHPNGRGKGIAYQVLSYTLDRLFYQTNAMRAYVDPSPKNTKALALYEKLGFVKKDRPSYLEPGDTYYEIHKADWLKRKSQRLHLEPITADNYFAVMNLSVHKHQENFVAPNMKTLIQAVYEKDFHAYAITLDHRPVGLIMYVLDEKDHAYWVYRLMVDQQEQGHGYGKWALKNIISKLKAEGKYECLKISFEPSNVHAEKLYTSLGFINTNTYSGHEIIYMLNFEEENK